MAEIHSSGGGGGGGGRRRGLVSSKRKGRRGLHVPEELLEEILVRLPVKSIIRFESVCKRWRSKFHSEAFIELYDGRRYERMRGDELETFQNSPIKSKDVYKMAPGLFNRKKERVISAIGLLSHGIYCLTSVYRRYHRCVDEDLFSLLTLKIALCNPATHQSKLLHPFPRKFRPLLARISEKPCRIVSGFGTVVVEEDSSSLDYRVVVLINYGSEDDLFWCPCFLVFVYSSQRGKWKRIVDYRPRKRNVGPSSATDAFKGSRITGMSSPLEACPQRFFKGCWYWITTRLDRHIRNQCQFDVLSFNFARQSFQLIGAPPGHVFGLFSRDDVKADVFVLHDRLAVIYLTNNVVGRYVEFDVWMMMDYGVAESWTRIFTVNPNFEAQITTRTLYGIDYEEEISGAICIKRLLFLDPFSFDYIWAHNYTRRVKTGKIISFDDNGGHQATTLRPRSDQICLSTAGISTYVETLRRL